MTGTIRRIGRTAAFLLAAGGGVAARVAAQEPGGSLQVYLMTMGPGADIYERFGHNAIWIRDTVAHTDAIYNYGMFTFGNGSLGSLLSFAAKFAMGPQQYWLGVDSSMENELALYRWRGRDLVADRLNLAPAQRADLAARLRINALPQNRYYAYDYFRDNCATRVRDMLDLVVGGALKRATVGKPAEGTLRFHTRRSITNDRFLSVAIDAAFGPGVDRQLDQWDEMFLPEKVQQRVRELSIPGADGREVPLVDAEFPLLTLGKYHVDPAPPNWTGPFLLIGLAIAGLTRLEESRRVTSRVGRGVAGAWLALMGLGGVILLFFWVFSQHVMTWGNHNLLLLSPLALLLVPAFWRRSATTPWRATPPIAMVVMVSVAIGTLLALVPDIAGQQDGPTAALVALPTFVGALEAYRRSTRRLAAARPGAAAEAEAASQVEAETRSRQAEAES